MKTHLSWSMISTKWTRLGCSSSVQSDISRMADCDRPVYCMLSPSFSGLNLVRNVSSTGARRQCISISLLDREQLFRSFRPRWTRHFSPLLRDRFVDSTIGSAADEADDVVLLIDTNFCSVAAACDLGVSICGQPLSEKGQCTIGKTLVLYKQIWVRRTSHHARDPAPLS